jgi:hypothetical protein
MSYKRIIKQLPMPIISDKKTLILKATSKNAKNKAVNVNERSKMPFFLKSDFRGSLKVL